jgi:hypothetical protein
VFMTPRLSTSVAKNKTKLPPDSLKLISESFAETFADFLTSKQVVAEGVLYLEELLLRVGFKEPGALRQFNFEASLEYSQENQEELMEKIYAAVDAIQSMMAEYVEAAGDIEFPKQWQSYEFDEKPVWLRVSTDNGDLEAQADALLGAEFLEDQDRENGIDEEFVDELFAKLRAMKH